MFSENGRIILLQVKVLALNLLFDEAFMRRLKAFFQVQYKNFLRKKKPLTPKQLPLK